MLKKTILLLCAICTVSFTLNGCSKDATTVEINATIKGTDLSHSAQWIRVYPTGSAKSVEDVVIHSPVELEEFYERNKSKYRLEGGDFTGGFWDVCDQYDDAFFTSGNLLIVGDGADSSSTGHELASMEKNEDGTWKVVVHRLIHKVDTCDLVAWMMFIEVGKDIDTIDDVVVDITSKLVSDDYALW